MEKSYGPNRLWKRFGKKSSGLDRIPKGLDRCLISLGWDWGQNPQKIARGPYFFFWSPRGSHVKWYRPNRLGKTLGKKIPGLDTILWSPDKLWTGFEKKGPGVDKNPTWLGERFIGCPKGFMEKSYGPNRLWKRFGKKSSGLDGIPRGPDRCLISLGWDWGQNPKKIARGPYFFFWSPRGSHVKWYKPNRLGKTLGKKIPGLDTILWGPDRLWTGFGKKVSGVDKNPTWLGEGFIGCPKGIMEIPRGPDRCLTSLGWDWGQNPQKIARGPYFFFWSPRGSHVKWYRPNRLGRTLGKKIPGLDTILWGPDKLWTGFEKKVSGVDKNPFWLNEGFIGCPKGFMEKPDGPNWLGRTLEKKIPGLDTILWSPDRLWTGFGKKVSGVDKNPFWLSEGFIGCPKGFMEKSDGPNWLGRTLEKESSGLDTILWGPDRLWTGFGKKVSGGDKNPFWPNEGLIGCPKGLMEKSYGPNRLGRRLGTKHFRVW